MIRTAILVVVLTVFVGALGWSLYRGYRSGFSVPDETRQLVIGTTASWSSTVAEIRRFERDGAGKPWRQVGKAAHANIGHEGLALGLGLWPHEGWMPRWMPRIGWKKEGDFKSPAGVFQLGIFQCGYGSGWKPGYSSARIRVGLSADMVCVNDPDSARYNWLTMADEQHPADWKSAEELNRGDNLYSRLVVIGHNGGAGPAKPRPGAGSCIFFHVERGPNTSTLGCTSMPLEEMNRLMDWLDRTKHPLYILLPAAEYRNLWIGNFRSSNPGLPTIE